MRAYWIGALAVLAALALAAGAFAPLVPEGTPVSDVARLMDSLAPWFLGSALGGSLVLIGLGARWTGGGLAVLAVSTALLVFAQHVRLSLPLTPDRPADLRVLFLNALSENAAQSHRIVEAALALEPDVIVFAEAEALYPALPTLRRAYAFVSPCAYEACEVLVATARPPVRFWRLTLNEIWDDRYAVTELETRSGRRVFVTGLHLVKPWMAGVAEVEQARLAAQFDWLSGPVVALGDFNAAPWSQPMRELLDFTGYRALRRPLPTWPAVAGRLGVPIDHLLVHNGARVVQVVPFGDGMGSNHRGFWADIALPEPDTSP